MPQRLFLLDAYALIFRAYYALIRVPRLTSQGFNTSAIFGFVNTLEELLRKENPSHLAVCFDPPGPTFRHEAFEAYKGERQATPEDIKLSIPIIKEIVEAYNIPILEVPGFEADDVIGTMAVKAADQGFTAYMMTPDKDFGQLVTPQILQYKPSYRGQDFELRGPEQVCARYSIESPRQVIDLLALMGDKVDNIPGCPGVGEKTAIRLISEFGSVDQLVARTPELKGALKKKIEENTEQIIFSKYLATIKTDVPLDVNPEDLRRRQPDLEKLTTIFTSLEFRTLLERITRRLAGTAETPAVKKEQSRQPSLFDFQEETVPFFTTSQLAEGLEPTAMEVKSVPAPPDFEALVRKEKKAGLFTLASAGPDMVANPAGWSVALPSNPSQAFWLPATPENARTILTLLEDPEIEIISSSLKRDYIILARMLSKHDIALPACTDVTLMHYLLSPDTRHSLPLMASSILGTEIPSWEQLTGKKGARQPDPSTLPAEKVQGWSAANARVSLALYAPLAEKIKEKELESLLSEIELPMVGVLARMELTGVCLDSAALDQAATEMSEKLASIEKEIYAIAGLEFNVGSPARVGEILFDHMHLASKPKKTKTGQYSTSEEELEKISHLSPIVPLILSYRGLKKLISTYLTALPQAVNPQTGRIHTTYNQTVTATGRISSSDPNLQNIPVREALGREIRRAFIPSPGNLFLSADYSQIELRLAADFAHDPVMADAFLHEKDIHAITAAKIFHTTPEEVTDDQRRRAKTANFGILYGISAFGLAQRLGIPRAEAKDLIDGYFASFPTIQQYISQSVEHAREKGYVQTLYGRPRPLPDINSRNPTVRSYAERNAVNSPIQGTAADIIKKAMVAIDAEMREKQMRSRMIMQVHDELNFDVYPSELPALQELVGRQMRAAYTGPTPLTPSMGTASNWLEAH